MKKILTFILVLFSSSTLAEDNALERALNERWIECREGIFNNNFKGEPLLEDVVDIPHAEHELRKKFFIVPDEAIEKFIIGKDGQAAYAVYREKILCAGKIMNQYCGSSGCTRDLAINDKIFELHGGEPILVDANGKPVLLVGKSGANCNTGPNAADCFQAFVWDEQFKQFNAFGGHKRPIR